MSALGVLESPLEHDKWFISVSLAVDPHRWCSCHARGDGHASSGAQKATFATPTCRHKHVDTIRFEHCLSENQRGQSVVAGRAPMRRFVQQSLPFSTSTRFVNSLVIKLSEQPRVLPLKRLAKPFYREWLLICVSQFCSQVSRRN